MCGHGAHIDADSAFGIAQQNADLGNSLTGFRVVRTAGLHDRGTLAVQGDDRCVVGAGNGESEGGRVDIAVHAGGAESERVHTGVPVTQCVDGTAGQGIFVGACDRVQVEIAVLPHHGDVAAVVHVGGAVDRKCIMAGTARHREHTRVGARHRAPTTAGAIFGDLKCGLRNHDGGHTQGRLKGVSGQGGGIDGARLVLEIGVTALRCRPSGIHRGGHISTGGHRQRIHKRGTVFALGHIAAVQQEIAIRRQRGTKGGERIAVVSQIG